MYLTESQDVMNPFDTTDIFYTHWKHQKTRGLLRRYRKRLVAWNRSKTQEKIYQIYETIIKFMMYKILQQSKEQQNKQLYWPEVWL